MKKIISKTLCVLILFMLVFSLTSHAAEVGVSYTLGDLNGDGKITPFDARICLRAAVGIETLTEQQKIAANVLLNNKIVIANAKRILRKAVNIEPFLGIAMLTAEQEIQIRKDLIAFFSKDPNEIYPPDHYRFCRYYGTYNGSIVFAYGSTVTLGTIGNIETVGGIDFLYHTSGYILVWNDGHFLRLGDAYEQGWLSLENLQSIADIHYKNEGWTR